MSNLKDTLLKMLTLPKQDVMKQFESLAGYEVFVGDDRDFMLLVPVTKKIVPVLLCAHVDTVVIGDVFLDISENGVIKNTIKDRPLGADDRAGCAILYEIANNFTSKPLILLTDFEETGFRGMHSFVQSNLMREIREAVYQIVSVDVADDRPIARYYGAALNEMTEQTLVDLDIAVHQGYVLTDGYLLEKIYEIPHVNLSYGGTRQHTPDEQIRLMDFEHCYHRVCDFIKHVTVDHRDFCGVSEYHNTDVCEVCNSLNRVGKYDKQYEAILCFSCRNRVINRKAKKIGEDLVKEEQKNLLKQTHASILANLNKLYLEGNSEPRYQMCPLCGSKVVVYNSKHKCCTCIKCKGNYFHEVELYGYSDIFNGDIIQQHDKVLGLDVSIVVHQGKVYSMNSNDPASTVGKYSEYLTNDNPYFKRCHSCDEIHPAKYMTKRDVLMSTITGETNKLILCKSCVSKHKGVPYDDNQRLNS